MKIAITLEQGDVHALYRSCSAAWAAQRVGVAVMEVLEEFNLQETFERYHQEVFGQGTLELTHEFQCRFVEGIHILRGLEKPKFVDWLVEEKLIEVKEVDLDSLIEKPGPKAIMHFWLAENLSDVMKPSTINNSSEGS